MHGSAQPSPQPAPQPDERSDRLAPNTAEAPVVSEGPKAAGLSGTPADRSPADKAKTGNWLDETELDAALQLLVERAQYITGATGTALALPQGTEMVCRASAGSSAPAIGARLQVRSGLTGESITRRQLLRCDNAESDPRVNLEACRALGIASIVVLPLLRTNGEVRGLFELFSDHPYAFEERDLVALERMADLTLTALDLAEQRHSSGAASTPAQVGTKPQKAADAKTAGQTSSSFASATAGSIERANVTNTVLPETVAPKVLEAATVPSAPNAAPAAITQTTAAEPREPVVAAAPVPEAMMRVQKCASCGFPVSEGRTLCLDCEKKDSDQKHAGQGNREPGQVSAQLPAQAKVQTNDSLQVADGAEISGADPSPEQESLPAFLANAVPVQESWMSNHVNLLAIVVLILGILVAVVVFR